MSIDSLFLKLVNMSIVAGWMILAIVLLRLILKKAPRWIFCILWALVAVRLICPFSFESALSLIPSSETIPEEFLYYDAASGHTTAWVDVVDNPVFSQDISVPVESPVSFLQTSIMLLSLCWVLGLAILLMYAIISFLLLRRSVRASVIFRDNIQYCDDIKSPFILGIIKPIIYIPSSLTGEALESVLAHEAAHIRRHDHWWKPLGYLLLTVYWFNPLCWLAYILLCRDIEMACDEKVIRDMDNSAKAAYSQALLNCSFPRKRIAACPLAFGEVGVKERVKSVLNYKKPAFWIIAVAVVACVAVGVCFLTNPDSDRYTSDAGSQEEEQLQDARQYDDARVLADISSKFPVEIQLLDTVSNSDVSYYQLRTALKGTGFSSVGQVLADSIAQDWAKYDGMTQEQRMCSSHMPGWVSLEFDNWSDCEKAIGFSVDNPLESLGWLNRTGYFGSESSNPDMPVQFIQASANATNIDRKLREINIESGYSVGNAHITLTATLYDGDGEYDHRFDYSGYATYEKNTVLTGSGIPVLMVTTDGTNNTGFYSHVFADVSAFWVQGNVFYNLRVFGDIKDKDEIQAVLDKIVAEI